MCTVSLPLATFLLSLKGIEPPDRVGLLIAVTPQPSKHTAPSTRTTAWIRPRRFARCFCLHTSSAKPANPLPRVLSSTFPTDRDKIALPIAFPLPGCRWRQERVPWPRSGCAKSHWVCARGRGALARLSRAGTRSSAVSPARPTLADREQPSRSARSGGRS